MRYWLAIIISIVAMISCHATEVPPQVISDQDSSTTSTTALEIQNLAGDFVSFWDATRGRPIAERVATFKTTIGSRFAEFYGIERYAGHLTQEDQDARIAKAIESFGPIRDAYIAKISQFNTDLTRHLATFKAAFPDFHSETPIYLLHSLGEMDGGTRDLNGKSYLIFGVDGMVHYHTGTNEAAFFHHELFHLYHQQLIGECKESGIWESLWHEGLAVYVSHVLDPDANDKEMLLDLPESTVAKTEAQLPAAFEQLEQVLAKDDEALYPPLFQFKKDQTGLPPRRGYFLGYLVAREIGKTRDLRALAKLSCHDAHDLVFSTVHALKLQAAAAK